MHRGLNKSVETLLKLWKVFTNENPAIKAQDNHHPMVDHNENSSILFICSSAVVKPAEGPANIMNPLLWYLMMLKIECYHLGSKMGASCSKNNSTMGGPWGLTRAHKVTLTLWLPEHHRWNQYHDNNWVDKYFTILVKIIPNKTHFTTLD